MINDAITKIIARQNLSYIEAKQVKPAKFKQLPFLQHLKQKRKQLKK